jgi:hypothetical protein
VSSDLSEPPYTERYVRWCERTGVTTPSYANLLFYVTISLPCEVSKQKQPCLTKPGYRIRRAGLLFLYYPLFAPKIARILPELFHGLFGYGSKFLIEMTFHHFVQQVLLAFEVVKGPFVFQISDMMLSIIHGVISFFRDQAERRVNDLFFRTFTGLVFHDVLLSQKLFILMLNVTINYLTIKSH